MIKDSIILIGINENKTSITSIHTICRNKIHLLLDIRHYFVSVNQKNKLKTKSLHKQIESILNFPKFFFDNIIFYSAT